MISAYSNVHRGFLQSCILHGIVTVPQALKILTHLYGKFQPNDPAPTEDHLQEFIEEINARIGRFEQKLTHIEYDPTQTTFYVFTNLSHSPLDRFQTAYPEAELNFFRVVLHELVKADSHRVGQIDCLNLTSKIDAGRNFTKARAEALIGEWQTQGYLVQEEDDQIGFGPRAMVEFDRYLADKFPDHMDECRLCKNALFYGVQCAKCKEVLHKVCLSKYLKRMKKCPACKANWKTPLN